MNDDEHDNNDEVTWTFIIVMPKNMTTVDLTKCFHLIPQDWSLKSWHITQYGSLGNPSQSVQPKSKSKVSRTNLSFQIQGHFPIFGFLPQPHGFGLVTVEDVAPLTCCIQTSMLQSNIFRSWVSLTIAFPILGSFATALPSHSTQRCALRRLAQVKLSDVA